MATLAPIVAPAPTVPAAATAVPRPTSTTASPGPTFIPDATRNSPVKYRALIRQLFADTGDVTRLLSKVSIELGAAPERAPEAVAILNASKGTFELIRERLASESPPPGHEGLHQLLLDALELYAKAADALLPDPETQEADYWRFQGLMQEGGKNFHAAGAEFDKLRP